jgi:hypothetical protein
VRLGGAEPAPAPLSPQPPASFSFTKASRAHPEICRNNLSVRSGERIELTALAGLATRPKFRGRNGCYRKSSFPRVRNGGRSRDAEDHRYVLRCRVAGFTSFRDVRPRPECWVFLRTKLARRPGRGHEPSPDRRYPRALVHRPCLKTAFYESFNILNNPGWDPELSTCALPGLYQRSRLRFSSRWCWFWPAPARGPQPSASKHFGQMDRPALAPFRPPAKSVVPFVIGRDLSDSCSDGIWAGGASRRPPCMC